MFCISSIIVLRGNERIIFMASRACAKNDIIYSVKLKFVGSVESYKRSCRIIKDPMMSFSVQPFATPYNKTQVNTTTLVFNNFIHCRSIHDKFRSIYIRNYVLVY